MLKFWCLFTLVLWLKFKLKQYYTVRRLPGFVVLLNNCKLLKATLGTECRMCGVTQLSPLLFQKATLCHLLQKHVWFCLEDTKKYATYATCWDLHLWMLAVRNLLLLPSRAICMAPFYPFALQLGLSDNFRSFAFIFSNHISLKLSFTQAKQAQVF